MARYTEAATAAYDEGRLTRNADGSLTAASYRVSGSTAGRLAFLVWPVPAAGRLTFEVEGTALRLSYYDRVLTAAGPLLTGAGRFGVSLTAGSAVDDWAVR